MSERLCRKQHRQRPSAQATLTRGLMHAARMHVTFLCPSVFVVPVCHRRWTTQQS
jgi:hypothetical protein